MEKTFRTLITGLLGLVFLMLSVLVFYLIYLSFSNYLAEKRIELRFWSEVKNNPRVNVKAFKLWEGDSMVTAEIEGKGEVRFWYGETGTPIIISVGDVRLDYSCNFNESKIHFTTGLNLSSNSAFVPLFGFEINNLSDLAINYEMLLAKIKEFMTTDAKTNLRIRIGKKDATCVFP